jgi:hypothetical protein
MLAVRIAVKTAKRTAARTTIPKMSNKNTQRIPAPTKKAMELTKMESKTDVNGSYTGRCEDGGKPVQDADDL